MQTLTMTKEALKRDLRPILAVAESSASAAYLRSYEHVGDLDGARIALTEADKVIRAQEERIRQLENMALTDELTGLMNRRGFTLSLQRELSLARRNKHAEGVLVMVDLDGFKSINDLWGHCAGDDYLQGVAHALLTEVRANDIVARIGGDEFAILFTHMDEEIGVGRMNRLEKSFNSRALQWRDKVLPLRASFGLASYVGTDIPEAIMKAADLRLYAHKARRRAMKQN